MCNAIAVSLMIKSELGVSTISSVPVVLNEMFARDDRQLELSLPSGPCGGDGSDYAEVFGICLFDCIGFAFRLLAGFLRITFGHRLQISAADHLLFHRIFHVVCGYQLFA